MLRITTMGAAALLNVGCANGAPGDPPVDSSNPVACMAIFGIAANEHRRTGNVAAAESMVARSIFLAREHGGPGWIKNVTPEAMQIGARLAAADDRDAAGKLLQECEAQQNSNPLFRRSAAP